MDDCGVNEPTNDTVAAALRALRSSLPPSEARVARTLLDGYPLAGIGTIAELAERAKVSGPTVVRLVGRLGFDTFGDFQRALLEEIEARLATTATSFDAGSAGPEHDVAGTMLREAADNIVADLHSLAPGEVDNVVRLLAGARSVVCVGGWMTRSFADLFCDELQLLRPRCRSLGSAVGVSGGDLLELGRRDLIVAFHARPYSHTDPAEQVCAWARQRGVRVILFTDVWLSPISKLASHVLVSRTSSSSPFDSYASMLALAEAVIALAAIELGEPAHRRMADCEALIDAWSWRPLGSPSES
jgi:DNA-binding MurR/RpiR family transcriptional regulator